MFLYIVNLEDWIPFQLLEFGGVMVIKAKDEFELEQLIKDETQHYPDLKKYDDKIRKGVINSKSFKIDDAIPSGKVRTWIS